MTNNEQTVTIIGPSFSPDSIRLFAALLGTYQLNAGAPDFVEAADHALTARRELDAALSALLADDPTQ